MLLTGLCAAQLSDIAKASLPKDGAAHHRLAPYTSPQSGRSLTDTGQPDLGNPSAETPLDDARLCQPDSRR